MPHKGRKSMLMKGMLVMMVVLVATYLVPFIWNLGFSAETWKVLTVNDDGFLNSLIRSTIFAITVALFLISTGLIISVLLVKVTLHQKLSLWLSLLIIPVILGNVSSAFIWKVLLLNNTYLFESPSYKLLSVGLMEFWQYGSLFTYLFWLNMQTIKPERWNYATAIRLNSYEKFKDIILPHQRNLVIFLFVIGFIFCFYEESKIEFIFRGSRGTHTEMINHWMNRTYQSDSLLSSEYAFGHITQIGFIILVFVLMVLLLALILISKSYRFFLRTPNMYLRLSFSPLFSKGAMIFLLMLTLGPIIFILSAQLGAMKLDFAELFYPFGLTLLGAILSSFSSISFGILSRLIWQKTLSDFNQKSMIFLVILFVLLIIPPIVILICGFKWMQVVGYASSYNVAIAWTVGHSILSFPLLAGFAIATHFRVKDNHINYLDAHHVRWREKVWDLFIMPFRADYLLTLIIAFSIIWNESIINNVLSDFIPSFVTEINKTITGKAVDYAQGMGYFIISLGLALGSVAIWNYIILRSHKER